MSDDKNEEPQETDQDDPFVMDRARQNIMLWGGFILIPVVAAMFYAFTLPEEAPPRPEAQPPVQAQQEPTEDQLQFRRGRNYRASGNVRGEFNMSSCELDSWLGKQITDVVEKRIETLGRPYRLLPPGSMVTQDHNPARYNFELDENNVVIRVWCG